MAFPTSPTDGQQTTINGVIYTYSTALDAWTVTTSTGANISANNVTATTSINSVLISATGNVVGTNILGTIRTNSILNSGSNATGNIGNSVCYFNTAFVTSTSAQYADLAESYLSDADYQPGTVMVFGGTTEVTKCMQDQATSVAGVVSTKPAYCMNAGLTGAHVAVVALSGRVPCQVLGPVTKGDIMVGTIDGRARAEKNPAAGTIVGKALDSFDGDTGIIEIVVGTA
jgi:hypothetical protein